MSAKIVTLKGPNGVKLVVDPNQVVRGNPGDGCPLLVEYRGGTASYNCALGEGDVFGIHVIPLPVEAQEWLEQDPHVLAMVQYIDDLY